MLSSQARANNIHPRQAAKSTTFNHKTEICSPPAISISLANRMSQNSSLSVTIYRRRSRGAVEHLVSHAEPHDNWDPIRRI